MSKTSILIAEDHQVVREGLVNLLDMEKDFIVVGQARDGLEAVNLSKGLKPDILLLDIDMPKLNGLKVSKAVSSNSPDTRIIVLSMHSDIQYVKKAISLGVRGYLAKEDGIKDLITAIRSIRDGYSFFKYDMAELLMSREIKRAKGNDQSPFDLEKLTDREREIFRYIALGYSNVKIAGKLFLSVKTIEKHRQNIMSKLHVHNVIELYKYAVKYNILTDL